MDIIMIAIFQLLFLAGAGYGGYRLIRYLESKGVDTTSKGDDQISKTAKAILEKVPGFTPEDKELAQTDGTWVTAAPFPVVFDFIHKQFTTKRIASPKHAWKSIKALQQFGQIFFEAGWESPNEHYKHETSVTLELKFEQLDAGGTAIHFHYDLSANNLLNFDPFANQLVTHTNRWIRDICAMLTANPEHQNLI